MQLIVSTKTISLTMQLYLPNYPINYRTREIATCVAIFPSLSLAFLVCRTNCIKKCKYSILFRSQIVFSKRNYTLGEYQKINRFLSNTNQTLFSLNTTIPAEFILSNHRALLLSNTSR